MTEVNDLLPLPLSKAPRLSKSKFLSGLQCHKRLYLEVHQPSLATKPDAATQARQVLEAHHPRAETDSATGVVAVPPARG